MARYVKKKETKYDCIKFNENNFDELQILCNCNFSYDKNTEEILLYTSIGELRLSKNQWVVATLDEDYSEYVDYQIYDNGDFNSIFKVDS